MNDNLGCSRAERVASIVIGGPTLGSGRGYFHDQWEAVSAIVWGISIIVVNRLTKKLQFYKILLFSHVTLAR